MKSLSCLVFAAALALAAPLAAKDPPRPDTDPPPRWEQLTEAQRQALIAGVREHWNNEPDKRARMLERAERWQRMTPQQREQARKGMERYEKMSPAEREQARAVFERTRDMDREARHRFRDQWRDMTPEQRQAWIQAHPPVRQDAPPPPHDHPH
ncbi:DUF3106 domain-containing protein [Pseudoxanthomonas composti]|uniref:DUF3106 domain-containing protein n=1 Tax=Pseudoxanthomonas composti TaxID=2137479 RepID=A0A4Q1JTS1_9GAMM|nr:DUF3106 domain-containing protein [Pseudoxanthomonas composti]RXR04397.1 DUF3106 domain-containing protein [Pseudoxanthomonas composti]